MPGASALPVRTKAIGEIIRRKWAKLYRRMDIVVREKR